MTPRSKAIHGPNLVYVGSRVNELWPWPRNDLEWPWVNFLNIFEIWPQMTFWPWMTLTTPTKSFAAHPEPEPLHVTKFHPRRPSSYGSRDMPPTAHGAQAEWMLCLCLNFSGETKRETGMCDSQDENTLSHLAPCSSETTCSFLVEHLVPKTMGSKNIFRSP